MQIKFWKMQGCGNDFVAIDNRDSQFSVDSMSCLAKKLCARAFGIGADGIFFIEPASEKELAYRWHFYNNDGSRAEMCGNASRCVAQLAHFLGIAPKVHSFGTDAGAIKAQICDNGEVKVQLTPPKNMELNINVEIDTQSYLVHFINTGVPHLVVFTEDVSKIDILRLGSKLRYHPYFAPNGTNVNFVQVVDKATMLCRTYERGVENETYACGTGVSAAQYIAAHLGLTKSQAKISTSGKEILTVSLEGDTLFLQAAAVLVFEGTFFS